MKEIENISKKASQQSPSENKFNNINNKNFTTMRNYNYLQAVTEDVKNYIQDEVNLSDYDSVEDLKEDLNEILFTEDSVTGNASGSYTFNTYEAEENLCHNLDLLAEACEEFGSDIDYLKNGAEACDVTIRCYLLSQAINQAVEDLEIEF